MFRANRLSPLAFLLALPVIFAVLCATVLHTHAMGSRDAKDYTAGLQILTAWEEGTGERIPVYVWYPSIRPEKLAVLDLYAISAAREGKPAEGAFPVLLMSHDAAESGLAHHTTAEFLARKGFVVIAPTHPGDNYLDTARIFIAEQITRRPDHLRKALNATLEHPELGPVADTRFMGVIGFGTGGATALMLAGAQPVTEGLRTYCTASASEEVTADPYCAPWAKTRLQSMLEVPEGRLAPPEGQEWVLPGISALAIAAPGYAMLFDAESVAPLRVPVMLMEAERNTINPPARHARHLRALLPAAPYFVFAGASAFTLHSPCPEAMRAAYPALCTDPAGTNRRSVHEAMNGLLHKFMTEEMRKDS
ncbi:alpha/beta hydrolase family protein [Desulfovibrio psychrotolerans]|uniref:Dienelactone hydrolase domain-containing protein n=1 Tax=Desulfovibrio psychrotolerans TaxID=415242 RepID=A0A7J0BVI7_9BACT|nr:dienelactone hydrolase family protein [Desulfovibrio psychrotolerans]GFM37191.1 hypothetical protein DSM19430T_18750 [Desulfovibrio psychrotolerans]